MDRETILEAIRKIDVEELRSLLPPGKMISSSRVQLDRSLQSVMAQARSGIGRRIIKDDHNSEQETILVETRGVIFHVYYRKQSGNVEIVDVWRGKPCPFES